MPFLLLLVLTLTYLQGSWPEPVFGPDPLASALLTWGTLGCLLIGVEWISRQLCRTIRINPGRTFRVRQVLAICRRYYLISLLAYYGIALYLFGWGWTGKEQIGKFPGRELLLMTPFLIGLIFSWARFYDVELACRDAQDEYEGPAPSRWAYLALKFRHNFLLVIPPLLLFLIRESILALFPSLEEDILFPSIIAGVLLLGVFLGIPWILRLMLGLTPLPEGQLRTRLLDAARRMKFRCNDILVWNTRFTVANAMVTGPLPFLRYVVLSDRLIQDLEPEEVEAVFGHEVGHIKHHHMLFYLGFVLASLVALVAIHNAVIAYCKDHMPVLFGWLQAMDAVPFLLLLAGYVVVVFGFLSRRCERQADIFGSRAVSCQAFIAALEKVASMNGLHRERPGWLSSWQHSTIARRVAFLEKAHADPAVETHFQRRIRLVKWGVVFCLTAVVVVVFRINPDHVWAILK
ncbi:MAG TPA: M48 family metallopeptidase [Gemmataceae bacterium]|nr:M48 family metallopeptidase [Gemmataceae bacterium]